MSIGSGGAFLQTFGAQLKQGKRLGQFDKPFGFAPFGGGQPMPFVLLVQQTLEPLMNALRQA